MMEVTSVDDKEDTETNGNNKQKNLGLRNLLGNRSISIRCNLTNFIEGTRTQTLNKGTLGRVRLRSAEHVVRHIVSTLCTVIMEPVTKRAGCIIWQIILKTHTQQQQQKVGERKVTT